MSRKPPVPIVNDDEDEDLSEAYPSKTPRHTHQTHDEETDNQSTGTNSSDSEDGQSDEEDFDDGADGLQELDDRSLVSTLHSEVNGFLLYCFPLTVVSVACSVVFETTKQQTIIR